ncbi:sulfotransferase [Candidatus Parabeggiatoa sp. HSG14]|uniref:sulfotransferase family protein n=1 Tax=Candidatus Parabeggiatoa sp. HSG14 TaxID=3055593 RepID=UPI0025A90975|nr:sulfotransferase [Thiotrichales bacterium HSG14]
MVTLPTIEINNTLQGPYPIFCRGHSGGRLVCEAFIRNQIDMGHVAADRKDTPFFSTFHNTLIREIILNAYHYLEIDKAQQQHYQNLMKHCVNEYLEKEIQHNGKKPFGWKLGISLFTMPVVLDAFPTAKVIHLIRDGRDVMLSRLNARFDYLDDPVNRLAVFGDPDVDKFEGHSLTPEVIATYRNELEMQHWVTAVRYGLKGRAYNGRYLEVRYEDICQNPLPIFEHIFDFIEMPFLKTTKDWLTQIVYKAKIGKWKTLPTNELEKPLQIGHSLLKELDYL